MTTLSRNFAEFILNFLSVDSCLLNTRIICADAITVDRVLMIQMAVGKGVQIMSVEWVEKCWELRDDPSISATDEHMVMWSNCTLVFIYYIYFWTLIC